MRRSHIPLPVESDPFNRDYSLAVGGEPPVFLVIGITGGSAQNAKFAFGALPRLIPINKNTGASPPTASE
jgi:hypothetical protein